MVSNRITAGRRPVLWLGCFALAGVVLYLFFPWGRQTPPGQHRSTDGTTVDARSPTIPEQTSQRSVVTARAPEDPAQSVGERGALPEPAAPDEDTPAGTIRVFVSRGSEPVAGSWVHARKTTTGPSLPGDVWSDESIRHDRLDVAGMATFEGLEPGAVYTIGVERTSGGVHMRNVPLPDSEGVELTIRLGSAVVRGRIRDAAGAPVAGASVEATTVPWQRGAQVVDRSDDAGHYELTGLLAGETRLAVRPPRGGPDLATRTMHLEDDREHRWDVGGTTTTRWTGTVRNAAGEPALGGARVVCISQDGSRHATVVAEDGSFAIDMIAGDTNVQLIRPGARTPLLEIERSVPAGAWSEDLSIPGVRLAAEVRRRRDGALVPEPTLRALYPSARLEGGNGSHSVFSGQVVGPGRFVVDGMPPGRWLMQCNSAESHVLVEVEGDVSPRPVVLWIR